MIALDPHCRLTEGSNMKNLLGRFAKAVRGKSLDDLAPAAPPQPGFQPCNELERQLMAAATDPEKRAAFQALLLTSDVYAATT